MYREINNLDIERFAEDADLYFEDEAEDKEVSLVDLCLVEVRYLCTRIKLDCINTELIVLHAKGFSDSRISEQMNLYFPSCKELTPDSVKHRRYYIYRKMQETAGVNLGIITVMRQVFGRNAR